MLTYSDLETFTAAGLTALGYGVDDGPLMPLIQPGPPLPQFVKSSPNSLVFLTPGTGAGLDSEHLFDRPFVNVRVYGTQMDYSATETLAQDIDRIFLAVTGNATVGDTKVLYITRAGGSPALYGYDDADRYVFTCSYLIEAQTGL